MALTARKFLRFSKEVSHGRVARARFLICVHFVWEAWRRPDIDRLRTSDTFSSAGQAWHFCTRLKRWQASVKMRAAFGGHSVWQAKYLVNLDDILKGSKIAFC